MLLYDGTIYYTYNLFDEHIKECAFSFISEQPMTHNKVKEMACNLKHGVLGLAQCIKRVEYTEKLL